MNAVLPENLEPLLEQLENASELQEMQVIIEDLRDTYNLSHIVYHWVSADGEQYGCGTYSDVWVARYIDKEYLRVDPVIQGCFQRFHPVDWKRLDWTNKAARDFRLDAQRHGVGNQGFSIPIRGPHGQFALFTVSHDCSDEDWHSFTEEHRRDLILIAQYFNQKALELEPGRTPEPAQMLSPREVDTMTFLALGYNRAQVADTLNISEHTLRVYVESARLKLGAINTVQAVALAVNRGLIVI